MLLARPLNHYILHSTFSVFQAKIEKDAKESKKSSTARSKEVGDDGSQALQDGAELKHVEGLLKKPASKLFEPDAVIAGTFTLHVEYSRYNKLAADKAVLVV